MAWRHLTDAQWDQIRPHLPPATRRPKGGRPPRRRPALLRRDSLDSVDRRSVERTAQAVWQPEYLLATAAAVGSQRGVADAVAGLAGPIE